MNNALLDQLLYEEESDSLDFKSAQYDFVGASDDSKSELLKDILAFANSWCRTDAYILIGVKEIRGGKSEIMGISAHIDDASLQQFVNKKTNRPITFSYRAFSTDEGSIAILNIPRQQRPFYLKKDYGRLKASTIYVRRGSSTDEASLDEISTMGQISVDSDAPSLDLNFADARTGELLGRTFRVEPKVLSYEDHAIPFYGTPSSPFGLNLTMDGVDNRRFYQEYAAYQREKALVHPVRLIVRNTGPVLLKSVRIKIEFCIPSGLMFFDDGDLPETPKRKTYSFTGLPKNFHSPIVARRSISVERQENFVTAVANMLDVQPKDEVQSADIIYVGGLESDQISFWARVFADNLPTPQEFDFIVEVEATHGQLDIPGMLRLLEGSET